MCAAVFAPVCRRWEPALSGNGTLLREENTSLRDGQRVSEPARGDLPVAGYEPPD